MTDIPDVESGAPPVTGRAPGLGLSAVELGARRGIGPFSPLGEQSWHGEAKPCPSCGQLIRRTASVCDQCGQDLSPQMLLKMQAHCGPWYALEHVRPFPGVNLDRLIRQVRRGVLTATTIVRGPTTYHQWRFAAETPALSKYLGLCWKCQASVTESDSYCPVCRVNLDGETDILIAHARPELVAPAANGPAPPRTPPRPDAPRAVPTPSRATADALSELDQLSRALGPPATVHRLSRSPTIAGIRVQWIVVALVILMVVVVYLIVRKRARRTVERQTGAVRVERSLSVNAVPLSELCFV